MTLDRSNPSCTLDHGFLIIVRASDLGRMVFTMDVLLGKMGTPQTTRAALKIRKFEGGGLPLVGPYLPSQYTAIFWGLLHPASVQVALRIVG